MANMKKILLSGVALVALLGAANAADVPVRGPIYKAPPVAVFNWTGFYFGGHIGYGWVDVDPAGISPDGVFGGLQLGYNWQFNRNWVFGIETDIAATDFTSAVGPTHVDYLGTVRARLGYTWDRTMLYATGGLAYGEAGIGGFHNTHIGYAIGAGLEWAFAPSWSAKVEYLFVDLGNEVYPTFGSQSFEAHTLKFGVNYRFGTY
jgi:outer membrane immunogenic protein